MFFYHHHHHEQGCVAILSITWIACLTIFGLIVLPKGMSSLRTDPSFSVCPFNCIHSHGVLIKTQIITSNEFLSAAVLLSGTAPATQSDNKGYYYNPTGLMACEPFYSRPSYRILSTCAFYFPTTMVLMYCYGSSFHASRFRLFVPSTSAVVVSGTTTTTMAASSISSGTSNNHGSGINNGHQPSASHKNNNNNNNNQVAAQNNNLKVILPHSRIYLHIYLFGCALYCYRQVVAAG